MSATGGGGKDSGMPAGESHGATAADTDQRQRAPPPRGSRAHLYATQMLLILQTLIVHFKTRGYLPHEITIMIAHRCLDTFELTGTDAEVRWAIGSNENLWQSLHELFENAITSLTPRMYPSGSKSEGMSDSVAAIKHDDLVADIVWLSLCVGIARNALTLGEVAQGLAAKFQLDKDIYLIMDVSVKSIFFGCWGDLDYAKGDRGKQSTVKKKTLLMTCLQFLNNMTAGNEIRKLFLWVDAFDGLRDTILLETDKLASVSLDPVGTFGNSFSWSPFLMYHAMLVGGIQAEWVEECKKKWLDLPQQHRDVWHRIYSKIVTAYRRKMISSKSPNPPYESAAVSPDDAQGNHLPAQGPCVDQPDTGSGRKEMNMPLWRVEPGTVPASPLRISVNDLLNHFAVPQPRSPLPATESDFHMSCDAAYGVNTLQSGKEFLMKQHDDLCKSDIPQGVAKPGSVSWMLSSTSPDALMSVNSTTYDATDRPDNKKQDDSNPGTPVSNLFTRLRLVLSPEESQVLLMMIMTGIVPPEANTSSRAATMAHSVGLDNLHLVRCKLLLVQDYGRSVLRQLLVYTPRLVADRETLHLKFMFKILDTILTNGLLPFAFEAFSEDAGVWSVPQQVMLNLLSQIFKYRQARAQTAVGDKGVPAYPSHVEAKLVNVLFTEFRVKMFPRACAVIFVQRQVSLGRVRPERFIIKCFEMERIRLGLLEFLEFMSILAEHTVWKSMLADWELTTELVGLLSELDSLLSELDGAIPKETLQLQSLMTELSPIDAELQFDSMDSLWPEPIVAEPPAFTWSGCKMEIVKLLTRMTRKSRKVQDQIRVSMGLETILSCCRYDENNPSIKDHAILCLRALLEDNQENQAFLRELDRQGKAPSGILDEHVQDSGSVTSAIS